MRGATLVAVALLAAATQCQELKHQELLEVFQTWNPNEPIKYVSHMDEHAERRVPERMEEEHVRRKRHADRKMVGDALPIAKTCEMPGYTGQFCEFPICQETNPYINPRQFEQDDATYPIDVAPMGACNRVHTTIIDEHLFEIEFSLQADKAVSPKLVVLDPQGDIFAADEIIFTERFYLAKFRNLPAGVYLTRPSADVNNANCMLMITARTEKTLSAAFLHGDDRDRMDFGTSHATQHEFNALAVHMNNNPSPASIKSIAVWAPGNIALRPQQLETRFGCGYEFFVDSFFCTATGSYTLVVEGVDFHGFVFRRAGSFKCLIAPPGPTTLPPPSTPLPTPPSSCANGGVLIKSDTGDYCVCQDLWTGPSCQQALCANGGTPYPDGKACLCPNEFFGIHCEDVMCSEQSGHGFATDRPRLILVIRVRKAMSSAIDQVRIAILEILEELQFDPEYLSRFAVVFFNNDKISFTGEFNDVSVLDARLKQAVASTDTDGNCTDAVFGATATALNDLLITNKSPVYIITDALPDDYNSDLETVFQLDSFWRVPLYFIYVQPDAASPCAPDEDSPQFRALEEIAARTSGSAIFVRDVKEVNEVVYNHLLYTVYRSQLLLSGDRQFCGSDNNLYKTISIDQRVENLVIVANGKSVFLKLVDPSGEIAHPDSVYSHEDFIIWQLANPLVGNYDFFISSNPAQAFCAFRVYQSSHHAHSLAPANDIFWGFSAMLDADATFMQPVHNIESSPVFHLNDYPVRRPDRVFASLNIYTYRGDREIELYAANGIYRVGCSYNFYFPGFTCAREREVLHFNFFARDDLGYYIQRAGSAYCVRFHPTPSPPDACQNGGIPGPNGTCVCQPFFTGPKCEQIECLNGGKPDHDRCRCVVGFVGQHCQYPTCQEPGPRPHYGFGVDFIIGIELTKAGQGVIQALNGVIGDVLRDVHMQHSEWIRRLVLVGFNSTGSSILAETSAYNYEAIVKKIAEYADPTKPLTDTGCVVRTWEALHHALVIRGSVPRRSIITFYQSSIPDNVENFVYALRVSEELRDMQHLFNVFQTYVPQDQGFFCGANFSDFRLLERSALRSDGHFYIFHTNQTEQAAHILPTFYSSGVVYQREIEDCSKPANVYFPVDAHTQTIQVIVHGTDSKVDVFKADGKKLGDAIEIVDDPYTGWHVTEYRNPCDQEWSPVTRYCVRFDATESSWDQANALCGTQHAVMVDDLSATKHKLLEDELRPVEFWLGLRYSTDDKKWMFDYGPTHKGPLGAQTFWDGGKEPADPQKTPCAFMNEAGFWEAAACDRKTAVVCQRLAYDPDHTPGSIGDDDISPGKYYATVTAKPINGTDRCFVEIRAQSSVLLESAFNENLHGDIPEPSANIDSKTNYLISSVSIEGDRQTSYLTHALLYHFSHRRAELIEASVYEPRIGCNYEWITQRLSCEDTRDRDFSILHVGVDDTGNTFQRITTGVCEKHIIACGNGGMEFEGKCVCRDYWTGATCHTPVCQNGGIVNDDERSCWCPAGFGGPACELIQCSAESKPDFSNDHKTLAFVVEKTKDNKDALTALANSLEATFGGISKDHSDWIDHFELVSFTAKGVDDQTALFDNVKGAADALKKMADEATTAGACQLPIYTALAHLFTNDAALDGSEIFVLTQAVPSDEKSAYSIYSLFGIHKPKVSILHVETADQHCAGAIDTDIYAHIATFALATGGAFFRSAPASIAADFKALLPTMYSASTVDIIPDESCNIVSFIQVDVEVDNVYIAIAGNTTTLDISVQGLQEAEKPSMLVNTAKQRLYTYAAKDPGTHKITISTKEASGKCVASFYTVGGAQVFVGYVQGSATVDEAKAYAVAGAVNFPVYHVYDKEDTRREHARLFYTQAWISRHGRTPAFPDYLTEVERRTNCAYEYISKPFGCDIDEVIYLGVSGQDADLQTFSRMANTFCLNGDGSWSTALPPVTQPPPASSAAPPQSPSASSASSPSPPVTPPTGSSSSPIARATTSSPLPPPSGSPSAGPTGGSTGTPSDGSTASNPSTSTPTTTLSTTTKHQNAEATTKAARGLSLAALSLPLTLLVAFYAQQ